MPRLTGTATALKTYLKLWLGDALSERRGTLYRRRR